MVLMVNLKLCIHLESLIISRSSFHIHTTIGVVALNQSTTLYVLQIISIKAYAERTFIGGLRLKEHYIYMGRF